MIINNGINPASTQVNRIQSATGIPQELIKNSNNKAVGAKVSNEKWDAQPFTWEEYNNLPSDWTKWTSEQFYKAMKYKDSEQYVIDLNTQAVGQGKEQDTEYLIQINGEYIQLNFGGGSQSPTKYGSYISHNNHAQTLANLYSVFGKANVSVERFNEGEGPTDAEVYEMESGKNFYEAMRENLQASLKLYRDTHSLESKINIKT